MALADRTRQVMAERDGYVLRGEAIAPPAPGRPWVVFGNSLVTDRTIWDAQVAALTGNFGILRYDQAGHGQSGLPLHPLTFDLLGADLLAVMDAAGVARATYVGLSMGVPTGLAAHAAQPARFEALVLSDGQSRTAPGGAEAWTQRIITASTGGMQAFAAATAQRWLTDTADAALRARLAAMIAATPFEGFRACATALMDYDQSAALVDIAVPTLLIAGAEDGTIPQSMATTLRPHIAGAEMVVIPQAGHVPCFEQPQAFNAALTGFLARIARDAGRASHSMQVN